MRSERRVAVGCLVVLALGWSSTASVAVAQEGLAPPPPRPRGARDVAIDEVLPLRVEAQKMPRQRGAAVPTWNLVSREGEVLVDGLESSADAEALAAHVEAHVAASARPVG